MLVCHCRAVYAAEVVAAIDAGARDEFDVADACGAGIQCGGCVPKVTALLAAGSACVPRCAVATTVRAAAVVDAPTAAVDPASVRVEPAGVVSAGPQRSREA